MGLSEATRIYQVELERVRSHPDPPDEMLDDLDKARQAMEVEWLKRSLL